VTYLSRENAFSSVPERFIKRRVAVDPFVRLGFDLPRMLRQDRPDLLHVQYTAPLFCNVPTVVSVHDVSFLEHPEYFTFFRTSQLRTTVRQTVKRAARILTPSEFSKRSILRAYPLRDDKVVVLPNAVSNAFRPIARELAQRRVFSMLGVPKPIVLTVGDVQPRKNHLTLIKAFEDLLRAHPQLPHHLVIVGKETWYSPVVKAAVSRSSAAGRIHFTGFVSDDELLQLYGACDMFIYPSFYEGFGLPILEAMACHRAVACSNTSAMPEVADSAALLFDPGSVAQIVRAMADLLLDAQLRTRMERLGAHRATMFSWERTAAKTLDVYYEVANPAGTRQAVHAAAVSMQR
jgi:glycosyltransferase involved in cell wall biosynthesis